MATTIKFDMNEKFRNMYKRYDITISLIDKSLSFKIVCDDRTVYLIQYNDINKQPKITNNTIKEKFVLKTNTSSKDVVCVYTDDYNVVLDTIYETLHDHIDKDITLIWKRHKVNELSRYYAKHNRELCHLETNSGEKDITLRTYDINDNEYAINTVNAIMLVLCGKGVCINVDHYHKIPSYNDEYNIYTAKYWKMLYDKFKKFKFPENWLIKNIDDILCFKDLEIEWD